MSRYDDKMIDAFRRAARQGHSSISVESLEMITGLPRHTIHKRLENLSDHGMVRPIKPPRKPTYWKFSNY